MVPSGAGGPQAPGVAGLGHPYCQMLSSVGRWGAASPMKGAPSPSFQDLLGVHISPRNLIMLREVLKCHILTGYCVSTGLG